MRFCQGTPKNEGREKQSRAKAQSRKESAGALMVKNSDKRWVYGGWVLGHTACKGRKAEGERRNKKIGKEIEERGNRENGYWVERCLVLGTGCWGHCV